MKVVVALGMHRSGTSMLAGILHILGVNMGERLLGAHWSNPLGHFEDLDFVELNEEILRAAGGSWDNPPAREAIEAHVRRIASFIGLEPGEERIRRATAFVLSPEEKERLVRKMRREEMTRRIVRGLTNPRKALRYIMGRLLGRK